VDPRFERDPRHTAAAGGLGDSAAAAALRAASVCLALYVAFWFELDDLYWAGTTAALVCQPHLGASLRKGWFRMIGTVFGGTAIVALTASFPQNRIAFLVGLAVRAAACACAATVLCNFVTLAAQLAAINGGNHGEHSAGATGGVNGEAFMLAVIRCSEICIGIVCAGIVLAGTDFGSAGRRLAALIASISATVARRFTGTLALAGPDLADTYPIRRELIRRVIAGLALRRPRFACCRRFRQRCGPAGFSLLPDGMCSVSRRARSRGPRQAGKLASGAASPYCPPRPSRYSARSSWRRRRSAAKSSTFATSVAEALPISMPRFAGQDAAALRARAKIMAISEVLIEHSSFFDAGAERRAT
jgi:hypothetical protein